MCVRVFLHSLPWHLHDAGGVRRSQAEMNHTNLLAEENLHSHYVTFVFDEKMTLDWGFPECVGFEMGGWMAIVW